MPILPLKEIVDLPLYPDGPNALYDPDYRTGQGEGRMPRLWDFNCALAGPEDDPTAPTLTDLVRHMAMHTASWFPEIGSDADPYMDPTFRKAWVESARRRGIEGQGIMTPRADPVVESLKFRYGAWLEGMLGWEAGKLPDLLEDGTVYQSVLAPLLKHWYTHGARTVSRRPHFHPLWWELCGNSSAFTTRTGTDLNPPKVPAPATGNDLELGGSIRRQENSAVTTLGHLLAISEPGKQGMNNERAEAASRSTTVDATWDETLDLLEGQINTSSPSLRFLNAHGLLFAAIVWLQTGMGQLLAVKRCHGQWPSLSPSELGNHEDFNARTDKKVIPELRKLSKWSFSEVAQEFRDTFCLTQDECRALTCVECLRNLLAHAVLSNQFKFNDGPALAYVPKSMKGPCFKCRPHLLQDHENKGIRLDLDSGSINTYFKDLRMVGKVVTRTAADLGLKLEELL